MKKKRSIVALCLVACLCLTFMVMLCSASEATVQPAAGSVRVYYCQISAANLHKSKSTTSEVIGLLMRGEDFHSATNPLETWYFGFPGPNTYLAQEFGPDITGYINSMAFNVY